MKKQKPVFFIVFLIVAGLFYVAFFGLRLDLGLTLGELEIKGLNKMRYGIDIRGGVEAVYEPAGDYVPTDAELDSARAIMEIRLDDAGIVDREITSDKVNKNIVVRFPWASDEQDFDPQTAIAELGETALLTFKDPDGNVVVEGKHVVRAEVETYIDETTRATSDVVALEFNEEGAALFAEATGRLLEQAISIYMDDTLISAPTVQTQIPDGKAQITGLESKAVARDLARKINAGALPFSMLSENNRTISATLGQSALDVMSMAALLAFILICLFMLVYYRLPGFVACIALTLQVVGQLLALSVPQYTLTLPGIAAIILSIGMGVDANIIISERIKEEINAGRSLDSAVDAGFRRAFSSVFDGNITVIIVAVLLMIFGSGFIWSFGYSLLTGVILNFLAGVTATRLMIRSLKSFKVLRKPVLFGARRSSN